VMINERLAEKMGLQAGEEYLVLEKSRPDNFTPLRLPVRISGIWRERNADDPYWFIRPESLEDVLLLPEQSFQTRMLSQGSSALYQSIWYMVLNGDGVRSRHVNALLGRTQGTLAHANSLLEGVELRISPQDALQRQGQQVRFLTISLIIFSIPILGLIAYFIIMVAGMVVQRQQNEIAVLRSRGVSRAEVLGIYLLEGVGLGLLSLIAGIFLARYTAMLMGWTRSFLLWTPRDDVPIELSPESIRSGLGVIALTLVASVLPAVGAAGHTIISYKLERARSVGRPLWQRMYVDVLLLIPAWYGYQQLKQRGTVSFLGRGLPGGDPFTNPLLILTPALWLVALALLSARIFPLLMGIIGRIVSYLPGVSGLLALRYLTRTPRAYTGPVLLLILTLSLATFTASMARTLDSHLNDQIFYDVGADMRVADLGQSTEGSSSGPAGGGAPAGGAAAGGAAAGGAAGRPADEPAWLFLPVTDYLKIPGVNNATRVARSETEADVSGNSRPGTLLSIDRADFPSVAHWRSDYAPQSLGALMNALGANPNGILVSRGFLAEQGLGIGGKVSLKLHDLEDTKSVPFVVVGILDYFPTVYPEDGPFFVANLDNVFDQEGGEFPYEVWLDVQPGTTKHDVEAGVLNLGLRSIVSDEAPPAIVTAQDRPERQGLYGLLSVGFLASALLTGLGFLFYSVVSFQRRFIELGMLRAIGLSVRQMGILLLCEQALIIGMGVLAGTVLGIGVSHYFIPFLQVRAAQHPQTPPFVVLIAWQQIQLIYLIFAVLLGLALSVVAILLLRMKIFEAVKLGEAA
jgi:putative ABC transport system permease protein